MESTSKSEQEFCVVEVPGFIKCRTTVLGVDALMDVLKGFESTSSCSSQVCICNLLEWITRYAIELIWFFPFDPPPSPPVRPTNKKQTSKCSNTKTSKKNEKFYIINFNKKTNLNNVLDKYADFYYDDNHHLYRNELLINNYSKLNDIWFIDKSYNLKLLKNSREQARKFHNIRSHLFLLLFDQSLNVDFVYHRMVCNHTATLMLEKSIMAYWDSKKNIEVGKQHVNVGTVGHTLADVNVGTVGQIENAPTEFSEFHKLLEDEDEKTSASVNVELDTDSLRYAPVDYPCQADYIKNMITDVAQIVLELAVNFKTIENINNNGIAGRKSLNRFLALDTRLMKKPVVFRRLRINGIHEFNSAIKLSLDRRCQRKSVISSSSKVQRFLRDDFTNTDPMNEIENQSIFAGEKVESTATSHDNFDCKSMLLYRSYFTPYFAENSECEEDTINEASIHLKKVADMKDFLPGEMFRKLVDEIKSEYVVNRQNKKISANISEKSTILNNLIALTTSIEAGRVEEGRGFPDIASEINGFSKQISEGAKETRARIKMVLRTGTSNFLRRADSIVTNLREELTSAGVQKFKNQTSETDYSFTIRESDHHNKTLIYNWNMLSKKDTRRYIPLSKNHRSLFYFITTDVTGSIRFKDRREMVMPGDNIRTELRKFSSIFTDVDYNLDIVNKRPIGLNKNNRNKSKLH